MLFYLCRDMADETGASDPMVSPQTNTTFNFHSRCASILYTVGVIRADPLSIPFVLNSEYVW